MTNGDELDHRTIGFLHRYIPSVMHLEVLLRLHADASVALAATTLSREIGGSLEAATACLEDLERSGFLARDIESAEARFRFAPSKPTLRRGADQIAAVYARRKVTVITAIYSRPSDELRNFSDAFRFRKDDD